MLHVKEAEPVNIQQAPVAVALEKGQGWVKVELAVIVDGKSRILAGWRMGELELSIHSRDGNLNAELEFFEFPRQDVNKHFAMRDDVNTGFSFMLPLSDEREYVDDDLFLSISEHGQELQRYPLTWVPLQDVPLGDLDMLGDAILKNIHPFDSKYWRDRVMNAPRVGSDPRIVMGFVEAAAKISGINHVVVNGWVAHVDGVYTWLEDMRGHMYTLEHAFRYSRPDVVDAVFPHFGEKALTSNFCIHLSDAEVALPLKLMALGPNGVQEVAGVQCQSFPCSVTEVSKWLFGAISCHRRYQDDLSRHILLPVLDAVNQHQKHVWECEHVDWHDFGPTLEQPRASVVVPLYGRFDFVEHQMLEWVKDLAVGTEIELIYVVDDPNIAEAMFHEAIMLYRMYKVPFRVAISGHNRGFSAANNLGASQARGEILVFLNSDVIPCRPGWISGLCDVLQANPQYGAVGPRLLYPDGSIQHAGMKFMWHPEFNVWTNQHPYSGLMPEHDPAHTLTSMPAITGACLVIPRLHFKAVAGWDTDYLVGDFEDSDLCLKLRAQGLEIGYVPDFELIHLERQSIPLLGNGGYRQQLTLLNARRHQQRWLNWLEVQH